MSNNYSGIHIFDSPESTAAALAERIVEQTKSFILKNGRCVWAVSGGSSILKLYDALEEFEDLLKSFSKKLIVLWVDERAVPHSHGSSNFGNAYNYFWKKFENVRLIPIPYHKNTDRAAREYEETLYETGIETGDIDITILGMGTDGHTASLFPGNKALKEERANVVGGEDPSVEQPRVTLTFPFINASTSIYLFFYGKEKAKTFQQAELSEDVNTHPIMGIDKKRMEIYSDQHFR